MTKWIVVYLSGSVSYLCKWYGQHYEVEAEGTSMASLQRIADELNKQEP